MIKLILFDIDGTLRDEQKGIYKTTINALKRCKEQGIHLGICTGRTIGVIPQEVLDLDFEVIISGGGNVINIGNKVIKEVYFETSLVEKFQQQFSKYPYSIETVDHVYMNEEAANILKAMNQAKGITDLSKEAIKYEDNLEALKELKKVCKICLWSKKSMMVLLKPLIDEIDFAQIKEIENDYYYEIINRGCHKGNAVKTVLQALSLNKNEVMCFGDGKNDIEMFTECGISVAMANSDLTLLPYADTVCSNIEQELKRREII